MGEGGKVKISLLIRGGRGGRVWKGPKSDHVLHAQPKNICPEIPVQILHQQNRESGSLAYSPRNFKEPSFAQVH